MERTYWIIECEGSGLALDSNGSYFANDQEFYVKFLDKKSAEDVMGYLETFTMFLRPGSTVKEVTEIEIAI